MGGAWIGVPGVEKSVAFWEIPRPKGPTESVCLSLSFSPSQQVPLKCTVNVFTYRAHTHRQTHISVYINIYTHIHTHTHTHTYIYTHIITCIHTSTLVISIARSAWMSYSWAPGGPMPSCWLRIALPPVPSTWSCSTLVIFDMQKYAKMQTTRMNFDDTYQDMRNKTQLLMSGHQVALKTENATHQQKQNNGQPKHHMQSNTRFFKVTFLTTQLV